MRCLQQDNIDPDCYFYPPENQLSAQNKSLCIRTMESSSIKLWIVKDPVPDRCEATNITDVHSALSRLETLGDPCINSAEKPQHLLYRKMPHHRRHIGGKMTAMVDAYP
jgi:adenylate cyclase class 2